MFCYSKASKYFEVLQGSSRYFKIVQGNSRYFKVLQGTSRYCMILLGTSKYFQADQGRPRQIRTYHDRRCRWCRWYSWRCLKVIENFSGATTFLLCLVHPPPVLFWVASISISHPCAVHIVHIVHSLLFLLTLISCAPDHDCELCSMQC